MFVCATKSGCLLRKVLPPMGEIIRKPFSTPNTKLKLSVEQDQGPQGSQSKVQPRRPNPCRSGQRISAFALLSTRSWTNSRRQWAVQCLRAAESQSIQTTMVTSEHYVYLDDSLKFGPARLPTRSLTAELEEATEEQRGHTWKMPDI